MARDTFHYEFKHALESEGWQVTNDPLIVKSGNVTIQIDIGAERLIVAEKDGKKLQ